MGTHRSTYLKRLKIRSGTFCDVIYAETVNIRAVYKFSSCLRVQDQVDKGVWRWEHVLFYWNMHIQHSPAGLKYYLLLSLTFRSFAVNVENKDNFQASLIMKTENVFNYCSQAFSSF